MGVLIIGFIISLIPSILLYIWFLKLKKDQLYNQSCKKAFINGLIAIFPILLLSLIFNIIEKIIFKEDSIISEWFHTFIVLALSEELVKFYFGKKVINKAINNVSKLDLIIIMGIVGIAFGLAEDIPYAIGADVPTMIIRGVTVAHGVYGMVMGYFLSKVLDNEKKIGISCIIVPWFFHGLYDFSLHLAQMEINDWIAIVPVSIVLLELIFLIVFIVFIRKKRNDIEYTKIFFPKVEESNEI